MPQPRRRAELLGQVPGPFARGCQRRPTADGPGREAASAICRWRLRWKFARTFANPIGTVTFVLRVSVVGNSGSGKSTLARALAARLGVAHIELDAIFHQPGWQPLPTADFRACVDAATAASGWVVDGNYSAVRDLVWARADTVVWLDLPRHAVMRQIIWRTVRRIVLQAELWNGNRERWRNLLARDPDQSVIVWAWQRHSAYRARYLAAMIDPAWQHLTFVRIHSRKSGRRLLDRAGDRPRWG